MKEGTVLQRNLIIRCSFSVVPCIRYFFVDIGYSNSFRQVERLITAMSDLTLCLLHRALDGATGKKKS